MDFLARAVAIEILREWAAPESFKAIVEKYWSDPSQHFDEMQHLLLGIWKGTIVELGNLYWPG